MPHLRPGGSAPSHWRRRLASRAAGPPLRLPGPGGSGPRAAGPSSSTPEAPVVQLSLCSYGIKILSCVTLSYLTSLCLTSPSACLLPRLDVGQAPTVAGLWPMAATERSLVQLVYISLGVGKEQASFQTLQSLSWLFLGPMPPSFCVSLGFMHRQMDPFIMVTLWMTIYISIIILISYII